MAADYSLITAAILGDAAAIPGDTALIQDLQKFLRWPTLPSWAAFSATNFGGAPLSVIKEEEACSARRPRENFRSFR